MAVENGIPHRLVQIAASVVDIVERIGCSRADHLAIAIVAVVAVGSMKPLVRVLMVYVGQVHSGVQYAELYVVRNVAVVDVRRIVGIERLSRLGPLLHRKLHSEHQRHVCLMNGALHLNLRALRRGIGACGERCQSRTRRLTGRTPRIRHDIRLGHARGDEWNGLSDIECLQRLILVEES